MRVDIWTWRWTWFIVVVYNALSTSSCVAAILAVDAADAPSPYGYYDDFSWAIRTPKLADPEKQVQYESFIAECRRYASLQGDDADSLCNATEQSRLELNRYQPISMNNYTSGPGYMKTQVPNDTWQKILQFFHSAMMQGGPDFRGNTEWPYPTPYHNIWDSQTTILPLERADELTGGHPDKDQIDPRDLMESIWRGVRDVAQEWTGQQLVVTSVYGVRLYHNQSILTPHVDRLPLVTSAIINVAQHYGDEGEIGSWPLEVYDRSGQAHNVSMFPSDLVLYESHSTIHGRPFPFLGDYYANIFVHFQPIGPLEYDKDEIIDLAVAVDLPPYVIQGSYWEHQWRQANPGGWEIIQDPISIVQRRDLESLRYLVERYYRRNPTEITLVSNDDHWLALHEAVRQESLEIVIYLVDDLPRADVNAVIEVAIDPQASEQLQPFTPLGIAVHYQGWNHPITEFLLNTSDGTLGTDLGEDDDGSSGKSLHRPGLTDAWAEKNRHSTESDEL